MVVCSVNIKKGDFVEIEIWRPRKEGCMLARVVIDKVSKANDTIYVNLDESVEWGGREIRISDIRSITMLAEKDQWWRSGNLYYASWGRL